MLANHGTRKVHRQNKDLCTPFDITPMLQTPPYKGWLRVRLYGTNEEDKQ